MGCCACWRSSLLSVRAHLFFSWRGYMRVSVSVLFPKSSGQVAHFKGRPTLTLIDAHESFTVFLLWCSAHVPSHTSRHAERDESKATCQNTPPMQSVRLHRAACVKPDRTFWPYGFMYSKFEPSTAHPWELKLAKRDFQTTVFARTEITD